MSVEKKHLFYTGNTHIFSSYFIGYLENASATTIKTQTFKRLHRISESTFEYIFFLCVRQDYYHHYVFVHMHIRY